MTNRITGDFNSDVIEAFRQAYASNLANPEEHDVDPLTNLPSNVISNTSPWLEHTGLWKANDGMSRDFKPNQPFNPDDYFPSAEEDSDILENNDGIEEENYGIDDEDSEVEVMSEEEFKALSEQIWDDEDLVSLDVFEEGDEDGAEDDEEPLDEDEIDALINQILGEGGDEDDYEDESDGNEDEEDDDGQDSEDGDEDDYEDEPDEN
jgi:hypothetical protein